MPAELPLVLSSIALAASALVFSASGRSAVARVVGAVFVALATLAPLGLGGLVDPTRAAGRALWEWSAVGGPRIQAAYELDALSAIGAALTVAYAGAVLAAVSRTERRHVALRALVLATGFVAIALVVTDDLVAATVVLATLSIVTMLALFAIAPAPATARTSAYFAIGLQAWVLAALLVSRSGSPTFLLSSVTPAAVSEGAVLAATLGALLFAGLYPVVAWSVEGDASEGDVGPAGSLVLMPAGIGATLLLLRVIRAGAIGTADLPLPDVGPEGRLTVVVVVLLAVALALARGRSSSARPILLGGAAIVLVFALPSVSWATAVLVAAILTTVYAAVVSLSIPDHWETVRSDLALVGLWIGVVTGAPLAVAGGLLMLFARAAAALVSALGLIPDRDYVAFIGGSAAFIVGALAVAAGAIATGPHAPAALGAACAGLLALLELAQVGRRFRVADVPIGLDLTSGIAALAISLLAAVALVPLAEAAGVAERPTAGWTLAVAIVSAAAVVLARAARPLLPRIEVAAARSGPAMLILDPAPVAIGIFRTLEVLTTRATIVFSLFERGAGVWLAAAVIVALLAWVAR